MSWASKHQQLTAAGKPDTPFFDDPEDEEAAKLAYAAAYLKRGRNKFDAGYTVFPNSEDRGRAMQAANWYGDPVVMREIERLDAELTLEAAFDAFMATIEDEKLKLEAWKVKLEMHGKIKKPAGTNVNIDNRQVNYHLKTPMKPATEDEQANFAARFKAQQMKIVSDAKSNRPPN